MIKMYCPQCGRELDLDSGEVRFCRYCGFPLLDTKEALRGFSNIKRWGAAVITMSYALLFFLFASVHTKVVSLDTKWVYWLFPILMVVSVIAFVTASITTILITLRPAVFQPKSKRGNKETLEPDGDSPDALRSAGGHDASLLPPASVPVTDLSNQGRKRAKAEEPRSVIEGTTKGLNDRSHSG